MIAGAQFSVYRNPVRNSGRPFLLVLQSNDFQKARTRVVAPLVKVGSLAMQERDHPRMAPIIFVEGAPYTLNVLDLATVTVERLGTLVASVASDDEAKRRIQDALDAVLKPY